MTPVVVIALSIVGACAVVTFLVSLVFAARHGWKHATARRLRIVAGIFGLVCALLGVSLAFFSE
ncbi:hypothetical protein [Leucobacter tenebrionis]|uniref:hypothetical protein n=1 Tax=Leucobacter tenebrionis TaxID=2873270 RepID=UPI001CA78C51|nr:hypothetical protein [Leucobacter tenebrionis]QZY52389.1 hypothetical protein KVY00_02670 [Leucobacter tenebrionis]